ncbi:hypothetical protein NL529_34810, partial [Klebsiella pneumoniae]|nr:hypothetical protein [Klebsiella pneumoniae]
MAALEQLRLILDALASGSAPNGNLWIQMVVDRLGPYRDHFQEHFSEQLNPNRSLAGLLALAVLYH